MKRGRRGVEDYKRNSSQRWAPARSAIGESRSGTDIEARRETRPGGGNIHQGDLRPVFLSGEDKAGCYAMAARRAYSKQSGPERRD